MAEGARQLPVRHLSVRVPWHDDKWQGTVCKNPKGNASCLVLPRVHEKRDDDAEERRRGCRWCDLGPDELPACVGERGAFLAPFEFERWLEHPYASFSAPYSHFDRTPYRHPAYSAACVPFRWMLREGAREVVDQYGIGFLADPEVEIDEHMGFHTAWVQTKRNQLALLDTFFSAVKPSESLCFFYAKQTPLVDDPRRVIVAVGRVAGVGAPVEYRYRGPGSHRAVIWERAVRHTVRPDIGDGFVMPYHEILEQAERDPSLNPSDFVAFAPDEAWVEFSYASEHVSHDAAISALLNCEKALKRAAEVFPGRWDQAIAWIDREVNRLWQMRGPCPGLGSALSAFGVPDATLVAHEISTAQMGERMEWNENPWDLVEQLMEDPTLLPAGERLDSTIRAKWKRLPEERRALLTLLSRFAITAEQATRFYQPTEREEAGIEGTDREFLENPYLLYERDRSSLDPISVKTVDRGLFPDPVVAQKHPLPDPSAMKGPLDPRRVRALATHVLEHAAAEEGHTLLPRPRAVQRVRDLELLPTCEVDEDLLNAVEDSFEGVLTKVEMADGTPAYQLARLHEAGRLIRQAVERRIRGRRHAGDIDWRALLDEQFKALPSDPVEREQEEKARQEKAAAVAELYASRISVLVGPAGTGKTTLLKLLCDRPEVRDGVQLLAPTGKARVRMEVQTGIQGAKTIAQFLLDAGRYVPDTGEYRVTGGPRIRGVQTLVIDEASMLTEEQLAAVLDAVEPPERIVLVGDPQQLPPIGSGRPFLDIVRRLRPSEAEAGFPRVGPGYAELTIQRRQREGELEDLLLAQWFSGRPLDPGADEVWQRLGRGYRSERLRLEPWDSEDQLRERLLACLVEELDLRGPGDEKGFECSLGGSEFKGSVYFHPGRNGEEGAAGKVEAWQILTPVRAAGHGVEALNRWIQETFRKAARRRAENPGKKYRVVPRPVGREGILYGDKVIATRNGRRDDVWPKEGALRYVANGEIGIVVGEYRGRNSKRRYPPRDLEVEFSSQPGFKYTFRSREFSDEGDELLSLAYALTVHKVQGSEFGKTFVIVPRHCRILSRELLYTALTRQKEKAVILYQGEFHDLKRYSSPYYSEAARRLTNLFENPRLVEIAPPSLGASGESWEPRPVQENLVHRTRRGDLVRSKSEVIIADLLHSKGISYEYEKPLPGGDGDVRFPDFTIEDAATGQVFYWEHLGLLADPVYRDRWERKKAWYRAQGILPREEGGGEAGVLITTQDSPEGMIDSSALEALVGEVFGV